MTKMLILDFYNDTRYSYIIPVRVIDGKYNVVSDECYKFDKLVIDKKHNLEKYHIDLDIKSKIEAQDVSTIYKRHGLENDSSIIDGTNVVKLIILKDEITSSILSDIVYKCIVEVLEREKIEL